MGISVHSGRAVRVTAPALTATQRAVKAAKEFLTPCNTLSQASLAQKHGLTKQAISKYVRKWRNTDVHYAIRGAVNLEQAFDAQASAGAAAAQPGTPATASVPLTRRGISEPPTPLSPEEYGTSSKTGDPLTAYQAAVKWATAQVASKALTARAAAEVASIKFECAIGKSVVAAKVQSGQIDVTPEKPGRKTAMPIEAEQKLADFIRALRAHHIPVLKCNVIGYANRMLKGSTDALAFKHGEVDDAWYYRFLKRHQFHTGNQRPLEISRAEWATAENAAKHYALLEKILVEHGLAVENPEYNPDAEFDPHRPAGEQLQTQSIIILKPDRIVSFDETRLTLDQTEASRANADRGVRADADDDGSTVVHKSGNGDGTLVGGTRAAPTRCTRCRDYGLGFRQRQR